MEHFLTFGYIQKTVLALGQRFRPVLIPKQRLFWLPGVAIWAIFEFLAEAGDI